MGQLDIAKRCAASNPAPAESSTMLGGQSVRLMRLWGEGGWHRRAGSDEMELVRAGRFRVEHRAGAVAELGAGQVHVVVAGREHRGVAHDGAGVVLFRPASRR